MAKQFGRLLEDGMVLEWPTSGMSDQQKIAEAVAIADARRGGQAYETRNGVNLGAQQALPDPQGEKPWPKTAKKTKKTAEKSPIRRRTRKPPKL